ncbi:MAG: HEAT repeat domain-containing protein [Rhabdochlamydiaceae bacterium]|jgi:HEAT repeat protein
MGLRQNSLIFFLSLCISTHALEKEHVAYLMQSKEIEGALALYEDYRKEIGRHDFEILVQMCSIILQQGIQSSDLTTQLSSLFGTSVASLNSSLDILEQGIKSQNIETQLASLQMLARLHDDRGDDLITKAMASPYLMVRMEAGYYLAERKHRKATGHLEALMYKIPPDFWFYFPQFFALVGTHEAIEMLKKLMEDPNSMTRVEALLNAARFGRDDLLPRIRAHVTHSHPDEQEAAATALGILKDSPSIPKLERLAKSSYPSVKLAALRSLYILGDTKALLPIFDSAKNEDLYAISLLGELPGGEDVLAGLLTSPSINVRLNTTLSLLFRRDPRCIKTLYEFLLSDSKDLGFQPTSSLGHSLMAWKVIPSLRQQQKQMAMELSSITLQLRERMLMGALELPEEEFLSIASSVFESRQLDLVPLLVMLLENKGTDGALALLKKNADFAGAPLIRMYCSLSLFRLKEEGPYENRLKNWITEAQALEMIRFRPSVPWNMKNTLSTYELTPEESTRLLLECYEALSNDHNEQGLEIILQGIRSGHPKNRYALAGLLIRTLQ